MARALELAKKAANQGEVPVGAVLTMGDTVLAEAHNLVEHEQLVTHHAEMLAINEASMAIGTKYLKGCTLWVTLEPCPMCAAAIAAAKIDKLIFAATDPKSGGVLFGPQIFDQPTCHHRPEVVSGVGAEEAEALLKTFFEERR